MPPFLKVYHFEPQCPQAIPFLDRKHFTYLHSAPEDSSFSALPGLYASPRTKVVESLGLFWMKGKKEVM